MTEEDPYEPYPWSLRKTLKRSCVNLWGDAKPVLGRYSEALYTLLFGLGLIAYAIVTAYRYQPLLQQETIDSAITFGLLMGIFGAGMMLIAAAVAIVVVQKLIQVFLKE